MPDKMVVVIKKNEGYFSMGRNCWCANIKVYTKILAEIYPIAKPLSFYLEPIPTFVFAALSNLAQVSNSSSKAIVTSNYNLS